MNNILLKTMSEHFLIILFFLTLVLFPTVFVLGYVIVEFSVIQESVLSNSGIRAQIFDALFYSITVSITITIIDLLFGFPIAWTLVRKEFRFKSILNSWLEFNFSWYSFSVHSLIYMCVKSI